MCVDGLKMHFLDFVYLCWGCYAPPPVVSTECLADRLKK